MSTEERQESGRTVVELSGRIAGDLVGYAQEKIDTVLRHTALPVPHARVRVIRHNDPARNHPISAQANIDLNGRLLRVEVDATTPREAVDQLVHRLRSRLERVGSGWRYRHGHRDRAEVLEETP